MFTDPIRQATSSTVAVFIAAEGATLSRLPISDTPIVSVFTALLPEWAARTLRSIPPLRPSKICPYLSTRKL
jgi:hypothetical protein